MIRLPPARFSGLTGTAARAIGDSEGRMTKADFGKPGEPGWKKLKEPFLPGENASTT
jgi:hypothetical protein